MGLCKCIKKKVTNQFCFEHRVNVCEHCMVEDHPKCVVQSYLRWLNDSDYSPVCQLCQEDLVSSECIRLVCYDVFHLSCLDEWASKLPSNTAPAGYRCPVCSSPIFPPPNLVSPVADAARKILESYQWARDGLGMPLVKGTSNSGVASAAKDSSTPMLNGVHYKLQTDRGIPDGHDTSSNITSPSERFQAGQGSQHRNLTTVGKSRKASDSSLILDVEDDSGENKYKRRSAIDWFNRWLRTFHQPSSRHHQGIFGGKTKMTLLLILIFICSIIVLFSYLGKRSSTYDPMLDPLNNPNIRIENDIN